MIKKWTKKRESQFIHFLHFFTVFTGIFVVMTIIILQIISSNTYSTVDKALLSAREDTTFYVRKSLSVAAIERESGQEIPVSFRLNGQLVANTDVLVHSSSGHLLNHLDTFSSLQYMIFNPGVLNQIVTKKVTNVSGQQEAYRMITVRVNDDLFPEAAFLSVAINTTQLEEVNDKHFRIITTVMFTFWLISIGASLYLANWSRKPILENYERQKAFVENASHELRTPLTVLQNRLELLFRKPESTIIENSENIASSLDEVRNMKVLTNNLLDLARRDDGINVSKELISPSYFTEVFENYKLIAEENQKAFYFHNGINQPIYSDPALLKQMMTILFDNAIKYTGDGGKINFKLELLDKFLKITVSDNGCGISDNQKEKVFERFYRVDKARTRQNGGFGLGLSLAKQIVKALEGNITIKDNKPKGSIFEVKINRY